MIKVGIVGTGGMAHAHAGGYKNHKGAKLIACCDINKERAQKFAEEFNIPAVYTDYNEMFANEKLDAISNVTSDNMHAPIAIAAAKNKINVLSEKPMATSLVEAKQMLTAVKKYKVINMINFSYRNSSALHEAAKVIKSGKIGRINHVESSYLQSWLYNDAWGAWRKTPAFLWRLSYKHGSMGVVGDIGSHIYDMASLLAGNIKEIFCRLHTIDKRMPNNRLGEYILDANNSFVTVAKFENGAVGTIHSSQGAAGQINSLRTRVWGEKGGIEVDLDKSYEEYKICCGKENVNKTIWETVKCKPYPDSIRRFLKSIETGKNDASDFENGTRIQAYIHYSFESHKKKSTVKVKI